MRLLRLFAAAAAAALVPAVAAWAQSVQIVVPYAPGGTGDAIARVMAAQLGPALQTSVIVVNRPGATGMIGAEAVAKAKPDGLTLLLGYTSEVAINPSLYQTATYKAEDFAPITLAGETPLILIAKQDLSAATLKDFIAAAKAAPAKYNYASAGNGSPAHIAGELFKRLAGIDLVHVPYKGGAQAVTDVLGGHVDIYFSGMPPAVPHVVGGKVKAYAVTGGKRSSATPDVPRMGEAGLAGVDLNGWFGLFAPAATPGAAIEKLNKASTDALRRPEVIGALEKQGVEARPTSPAEFAAFIKRESEKYRRLIADLGITADK